MGITEAFAIHAAYMVDGEVVVKSSWNELVGPDTSALEVEKLPCAKTIFGAVCAVVFPVVMVLLVPVLVVPT